MVIQSAQARDLVEEGGSRKKASLPAVAPDVSKTVIAPACGVVSWDIYYSFSYFIW